MAVTAGAETEAPTGRARRPTTEAGTASTGRRRSPSSATAPRPAVRVDRGGAFPGPRSVGALAADGGGEGGSPHPLPLPRCGGRGEKDGPRQVLAVRVAGAATALLSGYGAIAVAIPDGAIANVVATALVGAFGWLAAPWCVATVVIGTVLAAGPMAWRRPVTTRLTGLIGLLGGLAIATAKPDGTLAVDRLLDASTGSGATGSAMRVALEAVVGSGWATGLAVLICVASVVIVAGVPARWWVRLASAILSGLAWTASRGGSVSARLGSAALRAITRAVLALVALVRREGTRAARRAWVAIVASRSERHPDRAVPHGDDGAPHRVAPTAPVRMRRPERDAGRTASPGSAVAPAAINVRSGPADLDEPGRNPFPMPARPVRDGVSAHWTLPPVTLLSESAAQQLGDAEIADKAAIIERTLASFNIPVTVREARVGPTVTRFSLVPGEGIPVKAIKRFEYDLQLRLAAKTLRIELPVPGRPFVGIEIPNDRAASVGLREVLESREFIEHKGRLRVGLGRDVDGRSRVGDLARMPHVLIAGQTGAGKSVCLNTIVASLLCYCHPDELNLLMIDPKQVELAEYEGIPHLRYPVVTDLAEAGKLLLWLCDEMERRYTLLSKAGQRHLDGYNQSLEQPDPKPAVAPAKGKGTADDAPATPLPYIVLVIDELADLMMFAPDDVEPAICRLTAKARAVGIHLVVATQRPSVNVVTGLIKANIPSRIAFAVASQVDSRVILDGGGAEALLGRGDMLYLPYDQGRPVRVQCAWVADEELSAIVRHWKAQGPPNYVSRDEIDARVLRDEEAAGEKDQQRAALLDRALAAMRSTNSVSVSFLQRKLGIGYPKAAKLMDDLEDAGHVELDETTGRTYRVIDRGGADDDDADHVTPMALGRRGRGGRR